MTGYRKFMEAVSNLRKPQWRKRVRWFLAEFLVVVVGVLVALAVSAWWQGRRDREHERMYLGQLDADLLATEADMADAQVRLTKQARAAAVIAHAFWGERPASDAELRDDFVAPWGSARFRPVLGNVEALIATGDINVIRSASLRTELVAYVEWAKAKLEDVSRYDETYYRPAVNELMTRLDPTSMIVERLRKTNAGRAHALDLSAIAGTGDPPFPVDIEASLKDRVVYNAYEKILLAHRNQAVQYGRILERARLLHSQVYRQLHGVAEPGNCQLERTDTQQEYVGTCGAIFDVEATGNGEVRFHLQAVDAITTGRWKPDETPAEVFAGGLMTNAIEDKDVEVEISLIGDGILRTQWGWFPVRALEESADKLKLSFRVDTRNEVPPSAIDGNILATTKRLLADASNWDRHDDRKCTPDTSRLSLYCAMIKATLTDSGGVHHRRPALQIVRKLVEARSEGRSYEHRLRDYNNDARTTLADVQALLDEASASVQSSLAQNSDAHR